MELKNTQEKKSNPFLEAKMANYVEQILSTHVKVDCLSKKKQVFYTYLTKETFLI